MAWFLTLAVLLVPACLAVEAVLHGRRLRGIPIRIHVNGTRGKTTVTRRLTAALRAAGIRTVGKVTGDAPLLILPDGTEQPIRRRGPARIQEQMAFVRQAAAWRAEAIVVECMALAPELQRVSEERMIQSTIGVITNVRPDHFEVMGEDLAAVAAALASTIPRHGVLVTADGDRFGQLAGWALAKHTRTVLAEVAGGPGAAPSPVAEHDAIVRAVCGELRIAVPAASAVAPPTVRRLEQRGQAVYFANAFSANDPVSTEILRRSCAAAESMPRPWVALLNTRADRPRRLVAFAEALREDARYSAILLGGDATPLARRLLRRRGREAWVLQATRPEEIVEEAARRIGGREFTLVGMGNAKGLGLELARHFEEKGAPCR